MISFSNVTPSDKAWMQPILLSADTKSADYSFVNIYAWAEYYHLQAAGIGDRVATRFCGDGRAVYAFPVGSGPLKPAMDAILQDAAERGETALITGVTEEMEREIAALYPDEYTAVPYPEGFDYLYSTEKLASLAGKKLHGKRNHIHKFEAAHPDWSFAPLTQADIPDCRALARKWLEALEGDKTQAEAETRAMELCFRDFEALDMVGGVLRVGGETVGFTMASPISADTLDVHFEKADGNMEGAYTMVNREFARFIRETKPHILWLNREDDMGLENLRRAKRSYYPEIILQKSALLWKRE